jgi:hypothetical protein
MAGMCQKETFHTASTQNVPGGAVVAFDQYRRSRDGEGRRPFGISQSAERERRRPAFQVTGLLVFDDCRCYFLLVVFGDISIAQCRTMRKVEIHQRIVFGTY